MPKSRIQLAQIRSGRSVGVNLTLVEGAIVEAASAGADVVVLPEATMSQEPDPRVVAEPLDGPFAQRVRELAASSGMLIVVGMWEQAGGRAHNALLITDGHDVDTAYRKRHTYDAYGFRESDLIAAGTEQVIVEHRGVRYGFATCYDLRFPALFTELGRAGAEVILVPASWGAGPGKVEQYDVLARARALDSQCFLLTCDQACTDDGTRQPLGVGHSQAVGPLGGRLAVAGEEPGALLVEVDTAEVVRARRILPTLQQG